MAAAGVVPDEAALIAFTRGRLAHYKCPASVSFLPALPRNPNGKILKRQLRSSFAEARHVLSCVEAADGEAG